MISLYLYGAILALIYAAFNQFEGYSLSDGFSIIGLFMVFVGLIIHLRHEDYLGTMKKGLKMLQKDAAHDFDYLDREKEDSYTSEPICKFYYNKLINQGISHDVIVTSKLKYLVKWNRGSFLLVGISYVMVSIVLIFI